MTALPVGLATLVEIGGSDGRSCPCGIASTTVHPPELEVIHRMHYARHTLPSAARLADEVGELLAGQPDPVLLARLSLLTHHTDLSGDARVQLYRRAGYSENGRPARRPTTCPQLYRGATDHGQRGPFWTGRRDVAERYAATQWRGIADASVFSTRPEPAALLAHVTGAGEDEYVVDPALLGKVHRVDGGVWSADRSAGFGPHLRLGP